MGLLLARLNLKRKSILNIKQIFCKIITLSMHYNYFISKRLNFGIDLPSPGKYATGIFFLEKDAERRSISQKR